MGWMEASRERGRRAQAGCGEGGSGRREADLFLYLFTRTGNRSGECKYRVASGQITRDLWLYVMTVFIAVIDTGLGIQ